jgi:hypothetical protein
MGVAATLLPGPAPAQVPHDPAKAKEPPDPNAVQKEAPHRQPLKDQPKAAHMPAMILQHVMVDEVDVQQRTISFTVEAAKGQAKPAKFVGLPVPKGVEINVGGLARGRLQPLKAGTRLTVELALEQNQVVVVGITVEIAVAPFDPQLLKEVSPPALRQAQADLEAAKGNLVQAQAELQRGMDEYDRAIKLFQQGIIDAQTLDEFRARLVSAETALARARANAKLASLLYESMKAQGK